MSVGFTSFFTHIQPIGRVS